MKNNEKKLINEVAEIFKNDRDRILNNWIKLANQLSSVKDGVEYNLLKKGFTQLLDDFIFYLGNGDLEGYYNANAHLAEEIALNDISYRKFIYAFHLFEDGYLSIVTNKIKGMDVLQYLSAIDHLHHNTIAVVTEQYFNVKDSTVNALIKLAELRDDTTGSHLDRTREYLVVLAKKMELDDDFVSALYKAGPLHDIGKVGIRDSILLKPFKLTQEEFEEMKQHTVIGAKTIDKILKEHNVFTGYLKMGKDIALYHHEKYDGTGYPKGLEGEMIPLSARMFAVVDAYDAIVSKRPYKEAIEHDEAVRRIVADSGRHFDPQVVKAFLKVHRQFDTIFKKFIENEEITA